MIKKAWSWIKDKWNQFNDWLASFMPGLKVKILTGIGMVGTAAGVLQEFVTGLPLSVFLSATQVAIVTLVLFSLTFWARILTSRA